MRIWPGHDLKSRMNINEQGLLVFSFGNIELKQSSVISTPVKNLRIHTIEKLEADYLCQFLRIL